MLTAEDAFRQFLDGNKDAFSVIIEEFHDPLIFFVNGYVKNPDTAEDIAADCFAELVARPHRFAFRSSLKSYLFSMAHHKAVNHIRKHARLTLIDDDSRITADDDYEELESRMITDERSRALHDALPKLNDNYRTALHLVYFEGMSYSEAAAVMHKSAKQIDNLVTRGKAALKKILTEEGSVYEES